ncbi:MAG TPA: hypothetical protein VMS17_12265 [Gemmataceae bacterium]|nr:hypothetical protein [Gemmataceae bacterium]
MTITLQRWTLTLLAGVIALGASARAQTMMRPPSRSATPAVMPPTPFNPAFGTAPGLAVNPAALNTALLGNAFLQIPSYGYGLVAGAAAAPYTSPSALSAATTNPYGYNSATLGNGAYSGSGYPPYTIEDPVAGFLRGTADLTRATADYAKNIQQARLTQTQADEGRIDYRRRLIDQARYERGLLPTTEELRTQQIAHDLARARYEPPLDDIVSAKSLNDLLHHLTRDPAIVKGPDVPLDEDVLKRIGVTGPTQASAGLGLLKDNGRLRWPAGLTRHDFDAPRDRLSRAMEDAAAALKASHEAAPGRSTDVQMDLAQLQKLVDGSDLSPIEYIEAKDFLGRIEAAVRALQDPNVADCFSHRFNARNVAELVDDMKATGLDFAAAAPGDEAAYRALHQALVAYDYGVQQQASAAK